MFRAFLAVLTALVLSTPSLAQNLSLSFTAGYSQYGVEGYDCRPTPYASIDSRGDIGACTGSGTSLVSPSPQSRGEGGGGFAAVRIRESFSKNISAEISVHTHWDTESRGKRGLPIQGAEGFSNSWAAGVELGVEYILIDGPIRPSVTLGGGLITFSGSGSLEYANAIRPAAYAGVGADFQVSKRTFFRVDGRLRQAFADGRTLARAAEISGGIG